ncbi:unnamed protein product [Absidia cylindrospora]
MPLTTEEPVRRHWLSDQLKDINEVDSAETLEELTHGTETSKAGIHEPQHSTHTNSSRIDTRANTDVPIVITPPMPSDQVDDKLQHSSTGDMDSAGNKNNDDEQAKSDDDEDSHDTDMENEINDSEDNSGEEPTVVTPPITPSISSTPKATTTTESSSTVNTSTTSTPTSVATLNDDEVDHAPDETRKPAAVPNLRHGSSQMDLLWNEMEQLQYDQGDNEFASDGSDDESDMDDELRRITESNRHIYVPDNNTSSAKPPSTATGTTKPIVERSTSISDPNLRNLLVFADTQVVTKQSDRKVVSTIYGAGLDGNLLRSGTNGIQLRQVETGADNQQEEIEHPDNDQYNRHYLVACDFSRESLHAMEWTMGTMLRDHDALHIVTVANREDNPDIVNQSNASVESDLDTSLNAVIEEAKKRLSRMMLYDIKLVFYSMIGRVKDVLKHLVSKGKR